MKQKKEELNRYEMSYSQADCGWMVVYASSYEEAKEMFENGDYVIEEGDE